MVPIAAAYNNPLRGTTMGGFRRMREFLSFARLATRVGKKLAKPDVDLVYGSRILGQNDFAHATFFLGGRLVSFVTSLLYRTHISDEPTCYKVFPRKLLEVVKLQCTGFEFCPELTGKTLRRGYTIREIPIRYYPRSVDEGKKIRWKDGLDAIWTILKYRFVD